MLNLIAVILYWFTVAFEVLLCFVVYFDSRNKSIEKKSALRKIFYLLGLSIVIWSVSQLAFDWVSNNAKQYSILLTISSVSILWIGYFFWFFAETLIKGAANRKKALLIAIPLVIVSIAAFVYPIGEANVVSGVIEYTYHTAWYSVVTIAPVLLVLYSIFLLETNAARIGKTEKKTARQFRYLSRGMLATTFVVFLGNYVAQLLNINNNLIGALVAFSVPIYLYAIGVTVLSMNLFEFSRYLYRSVSYILSVTVLILIYTAVGSLLTNAFNIDEKSAIARNLYNFVIILILTLSFQPTKKFFDRQTNRFFFRDAYDPQHVINRINSTLVTIPQLEQLLESTAKIVEDELKLEFVDYYLAKSASIEFHVAGSNTRIFANETWDNLYDNFDDSTRKIFVSYHDDLAPEILEQMNTLAMECAVKMTSNHENVGFLIVGPRKSGNQLSHQDIQLLESIADEVAIAVQNALRFEEISQFNITLQKKIDDATRELQKSNEKLQKLDEAKDEFISMASHQLRTPLTSVKGYISMMLEGDAGEITDQQKNFLDQAFLSSQRMVYLIADLLNVSRLKTGKFIIEPKPTYLPDVVESEIAQLHETAKSRELKLIFDKPESFPTLNLDETKIRQVIMNFADNAIYYTPKGGKITIGLKATDDSIEYTVRDTGIGVPKSEQHHLFTKFYRAGNAKKARPDGTGLGLFMAKKVVVAQGGAIIFKTEEGKGSTFGFSFPRAKLEVEQ